MNVAIRNGSRQRKRSSVVLLCTHSEVNILVLEAVVASTSVDEDSHRRALIAGWVSLPDEAVNSAVGTHTKLVFRHVCGWRWLRGGERTEEVTVWIRRVHVCQTVGWFRGSKGRFAPTLLGSLECSRNNCKLGGAVVLNKVASCQAFGERPLTVKWSESLRQSTCCRCQPNGNY